MASDGSDSSNPRRQITTTIHGKTEILDCLEPWLDDGNIVLIVQGKVFRVHRTILASYSEVFKGVFAIPHPESEDVIDGCPVVHLHDAVEDVQIVLKALYDRSFLFSYRTPMPISVLVAFLRIGKKYEIQQLFKEATKRILLGSSSLLSASKLTTAGDTTLFSRITESDPFYFTITNVADEVGVLSAVVMTIFYICLACPASSIANGYDFEGKRYTLSPSSMRYCLLGQRFLADVQKKMFKSLARIPSECQNRRSGALTPSSCVSAALSALCSFQNLGCPFSVWVPGWDSGFCTTCRAELRRRHEEVRTKLWNRFPVELGFGPWEDLDKDLSIL